MKCNDLYFIQFCIKMQPTEPQWVEHLGNMFETGLVQANECKS